MEPEEPEELVADIHTVVERCASVAVQRCMCAMDPPHTWSIQCPMCPASCDRSYSCGWEVEVQHMNPHLLTCISCPDPDPDSRVVGSHHFGNHRGHNRMDRLGAWGRYTDVAASFLVPSV